MELDPQGQAMLDRAAASGQQPTHMMPVEDARRALLASRALSGSPEPVASVEDRQIPGPGGEIPVRIYRPAREGALPSLVFFHGGGWVTGSIETLDVSVRAIVNRAQCVAVSVDYRLAPEHRFPAAAEDAYAATKWVADAAGELGVDPGRIAVGGDSAGGNLAAAVTLMARDQGGPALRYQVLIYPILNSDFETGSYRQFTSGLPLTRDGMQWYWGHYLARAEDGENPYASPLRAADFNGLPPALVITAEYDPLRDEGESYAGRLREAGAAVQYRCYERMGHGFFRIPATLDRGKTAIEEISAALRAAFER
jgi:acetyl esterase